MKRILPLYEVDECQFWTPPMDWLGETVFIIGGGSSLKGFDWDLIRHQKIIGANDAYSLGPFVDYCLFADSPWYRVHKENFHKAEATMVGLTVQPLDSNYAYWMRREIHGIEKGGFNLGWFGNTGLSCICLAIAMGAKKICLLGFDMKADEDNGNCNWHENNISTNVPNTYNKFINKAKILKEEMDKHCSDVEVVNCNLDSAMDVWPKVNLESVL